eukprot:752563-Hanusia_phi.AAC.5
MALTGRLMIGSSGLPSCAARMPWQCRSPAPVEPPAPLRESTRTVLPDSRPGSDRPVPGSLRRGPRPAGGNLPGPVNGFPQVTAGESSEPGAAAAAGRRAAGG